MLKMIVLISGYRRHGKDHFANILKGVESNNVILLYRSEEVKRRFDALSNPSYHSFARSLKEEVSALYFGGRSLEELEPLKDIVQEDGKSYRDILIQTAKNRREEDINYYAKRIPINGDVVITDWRYRNEYEYLSSTNEVITVRVHDGSKEIPHPSIESEHDLDGVQCDILVVRDMSYVEHRYGGYVHGNATINTLL